MRQMRFTDGYPREIVAAYVADLGFIRAPSPIETYAGKLYDDAGRRYVAFFRKSGEDTFGLWEAVPAANPATWETL